MTWRTNSDPGSAERGERIVAEVSGWPGVTLGSGDFGETEFWFEGRSLGHVHGGYQADIPFPRRLRDELVAEGRTGPHHVHPDSGWTTRRIEDETDAAAVVELLRLNYDRISGRRRATKP
jgi:hypothetical protein